MQQKHAEGFLLSVLWIRGGPLYFSGMYGTLFLLFFAHTKFRDFPALEKL